MHSPFVPGVLFTIYLNSGLEKDAEGYFGLAEKWFVFSMVWSVMAAADEDGRAKLDAFLRDVEVKTYFLQSCAPLKPPHCSIELVPREEIELCRMLLLT